MQNPLGRRAVLVFSDFAVAGWRRGFSPDPAAYPYHLDVLTHWQRRQPVVLLHLMPPEQWRRTALGCAELLRLRAAPPASPGAAARLLPDTDSGSERGDASPIVGLILPVIGADGCSLSAWARILNWLCRHTGPGCPLPA